MIKYLSFKSNEDDTVGGDMPMNHDGDDNNKSGESNK